MRIALIKIGALGDVVRTTSILPGLRRQNPEMKLTWITSSAGIPLVRYHPDVSRALDICEPGNAPWRQESFDWLISLDDDQIACDLASRLPTRKLSGAYAAAGGARQYTADTDAWFGMGLLRPKQDGGIDRANELKKSNQDSHGMILYKMLGLPLPVARPTIVIPETETNWAKGWLAQPELSKYGQAIGLNTGAGGRWEFKKWGEQQTANLAARIHDSLGAGVIILGGESELPRNQRIAALAGRPGIVVAPHNLDLYRFAALIGRCALLVSSDSLAMHLGLAADIPVVAFFGPTSPAEIDVFGKGQKIVTPLSCRCCYLPTCDVRPHCMASIGVERMFDAVRGCLMGTVPA